MELLLQMAHEGTEDVRENIDQWKEQGLVVGFTNSQVNSLLGEG